MRSGWLNSAGTICDQRSYWTPAEAACLFPPLTPADVRRMIRAAGVEAAGVRPPGGRGRAPLVYDAGVLCDLLGG